MINIFYVPFTRLNSVSSKDSATTITGLYTVLQLPDIWMYSLLSVS